MSHLKEEKGNKCCDEKDKEIADLRGLLEMSMAQTDRAIEQTSSVLKLLNIK